jgi:hypothetical protein
MSLQAKIMTLLSGISDPVVRIDIATTINYLFSVYASGRSNENEIRDALYDVLLDVVRATHPDLIEEDVRKKSANLADEFIRAFKLEATRSRVMARFRPSVSI